MEAPSAAGPQKLQSAPPPKPKRRRGNPLKALYRACAGAVCENSSQIANALVAQTLEGDQHSAKMLLALCVKPPSEKRKKKKRSLALEWGSEPEWVPPPEPESQKPARNSFPNAPFAPFEDVPPIRVDLQAASCELRTTNCELSKPLHSKMR